MVSSLKQPAAVLGLKWNIQGSLLACVAKDKTVRILDPRQQGTAFESPCHEGRYGGHTAVA